MYNQNKIKLGQLLNQKNVGKYYIVMYYENCVPPGYGEN